MIARDQIPAQAAEIAEAYREGVSVTELAKRYRLSGTTIYNRLSLAGANPVQRGRRSGSLNNVAETNRMAADRRAGMSYGQIGRKYGYSKQNIYDRLSRVKA